MRTLVLAALAIAGYFMYIKKSSTMHFLKRKETYGGVAFTKAYDTTYPKHAKTVHDACNEFNKVYQSTFSYDETVGKSTGSLDLVRALFSAKEDALIQLNDVRMRLPNDLDAEKTFVAASEDLDRQFNEYIAESKSRLGVFVYPGPLSSAYQAKKYRASNDIVA